MGCHSVVSGQRRGQLWSFDGHGSEKSTAAKHQSFTALEEEFPEGEPVCGWNGDGFLLGAGDDVATWVGDFAGGGREGPELLFEGGGDQEDLAGLLEVGEAVFVPYEIHLMPPGCLVVARLQTATAKGEKDDFKLRSGVPTACKKTRFKVIIFMWTSTTGRSQPQVFLTGPVVS